MTLWVLVVSEKGIIHEPTIFFDEKNARARYDRLKKRLNEDYCSVELFQKKV